MIEPTREYDTDLIPLPRMSEYLLDDFMTPMGLTAQDVSKGTGISLHDVRAILANMREITPEISEKLGAYFGVSAMLFYDIQQDLKARAEMRKFSNRVIVLPNTAKNGNNIQNVIQTVKKALNILSAAVPASA